MTALEKSGIIGKDLYQILGVTVQASPAELKTAYRNLVKKHHPDAGGDEKTILELNAAWEVLGDPEYRLEYDRTTNQEHSLADEATQRGARNAHASAAARAAKDQSSKEDDALALWLLTVYLPIDRLLAQVINPFSTQLRALSADPYDDFLMESFCVYLEKSRNRLDKVNNLYHSIAIPQSAQAFGLSLYHCLSKVEDAIAEFERYTMGYVDDYLHDGREMLREAKQLRSRLQKARSRIEAL